MGGTLGFLKILGFLYIQILFLSVQDASNEFHLVAGLINHDTRSWDRGKLEESFEVETINKIISIHLPQQAFKTRLFGVYLHQMNFLLNQRITLLATQTVLITLNLC